MKKTDRLNVDLNNKLGLTTMYKRFFKLKFVEKCTKTLSDTLD